MTLFLIFLAVAFALWRLRRRARAGELSGRDGEKPIYSVSPPTRRMNTLKDGML